MAMDAEERERLERMRLTAARYWRPAAAIVAAIVASLSGYYYFQNRAQERTEAAASAFFELRESLAEDDSDSAADAYSRVLSAGEESYRDVGAFALAGKRFQSGDFDGAAESLRTILQNSEDEGFRHIARLRLAAVMIDQNQTAEAVVLLDEGLPAPGRLEILYHDLAGDALAARGDVEAARARYLEAARAAQQRQAGRYLAILESKVSALQSLPAAGFGESADEADETDETEKAEKAEELKSDETEKPEKAEKS